MVKRSSIDGIEFTVISDEEPNESSEVTDKKVEDGSPMSDHMSDNPLTLSLTGVMTGEDAAKKIHQLNKIRTDKKLVRYIGRNIFNNMVIASFQRNHKPSIRNGYEFSITLKQVTLGSYKTVKTNVSKPVSKKPVKKKSSQAKNTKVKKKSNTGKVQKKKKKVTPKQRKNFKVKQKVAGPNQRQLSPFY